MVAVLDGDAVGLEDLDKVAKEIIEGSTGNFIYLFFGVMGAGKTTLIKSMVKQLGFKSSVQSPTFSIINEYLKGTKKIFHFDFFRIEKEEEAFDLGVEEYLDSGSYCLIEWPEKIISLIPTPRVEVHIKAQTKDTRTIAYQVYE